MKPVSRLIITALPVLLATTFFLGLAYASSPYDVLSEPHIIFARSFGHVMLASGIWFIRYHYRRYLKLQLGEVTESLKPLLRMVDPAVIAIATLLSIYAVVPIVPGLIPYIIPISSAAAAVLWMVIYSIWRDRDSIAKIMGRKK